MANSEWGMAMIGTLAGSPCDHGQDARGTVQTLPTGGGANRGPPERRPLNGAVVKDELG